MAQGDSFHVVVFTDTFLETNGVGSYYRTLLGWAKRTGAVNVTVICPAREDLVVGEVEAGVVPVRPRLQLKNPVYKLLTLGYYPQSRLTSIVQSIPNPKVIHIATSGAVGYAGAILARRLRLPVVGCYHTELQQYGRLYGRSVLGRPGEWIGGGVARWCDEMAYRPCQAVCVPSSSARQSVRGFYDGPTELIPNPIDVDWFRPAPTRDGRFRQRYGANGDIIAAVVGRVAKEKNLDLVCELLRSHRRIRPVFVGDGPYTGALKKRWGVEVTGFLHGEELLEAFQQSDLFVQLSVTETFGLSLVEALATGLPAMVLRSPGFVERITPGNGVEVLDTHELPTLADRCVALVTDKPTHEAFARRARAFAMKLSADEVLPKFVDFHRAFVGTIRR